MDLGLMCQPINGQAAQWNGVLVLLINAEKPIKCLWIICLV